MDESNFSTMLAQLTGLTFDQKQLLLKTLQAKSDLEQIAEIVNEKIFSSPVCPHCNCSKVVKCGVVSSLQRYRCKECKATFNALTGTSMARLRKKDRWLEYSKALDESLTLVKAAERCGIDRTTAFRWRHRFLAGIAHNTEVCEGITEIDETYFRESGKGKPVQHREPRRRGKSPKRGLSAEQIPVIVARDRHGKTCDMVLHRRTSNEIVRLLADKIMPDSVVCIENTPTLVGFARRAGLVYEIVGMDKSRQGREKAFHVQNVNAYHSRLKGWMRRFNGVATERLPNYLGWRRQLENGPPSPKGLLAAVVRNKGIHI